MSSFPYRILNQIDHRPWPMPDRPWFMTQSWHDLLFAHWALDAHVLRARVPAPLSLDLYDGRAWLGIVPFHMTNVAPRGVPALPFVSAFPELNVRTYVTVAGKSGVYFFSLDAGSTAAVLAARTVFGLPYFTADMDVRLDEGEVRYTSRRTQTGSPEAAFVARYRPVGPVAAPQPGSLEHFLTERYCLYTVDDESRVRRLEIHHPAWPLQAAEADIVENTMANAAGIALPAAPPLLHFARRQDMVAWPPETV